MLDAILTDTTGWPQRISCRWSCALRPELCRESCRVPDYKAVRNGFGFFPFMPFTIPSLNYIYIYSTNMYILNGYHMSIKWKCLNMCAYVSPNQKSHMMLESAPCLWEPGKLSCREACCLDTCFSRRGTLPTPHLHSPLALRDKLQHLGFGRITVAVTEMGSMDKERTDSLNAVPHELQCCHDT